MQKVKIAVLGLNQGYKFAKDSLNMPEDVELVAVAGNNELAKERAKELNVPLYTDYKDLIQECDLDGVIISLPNDLHREAVEIAAQKGIHVLVEKPIASTIEDGEAIIQACKKNNVKLLVGHHRRFSSKVKKLKEIISSGKLGKIIGINMLWVLSKDKAYFSEKWRLTKGGGPLLINGIHEIDTLRFVTGLRIKRVYASMNNRIRNNPVEDSAAVLLETGEGVTINYFLSDGVPSPWSYDLNVKENPKFHHHEANCYKIFGSEGSLSFPDFYFYSYDDEKYGWEYPLVIEKIPVEDNDPMTEELKHFIDVLRGKAEPAVTGEDALETLKVIKAIKLSSEKGEAVAI